MVGRDAQAEKLRVRYVEQGLRAKLLSMVPGKNELQKAFKFFDCDDSGCIDAAEFRIAYRSVAGEDLAAADCDAVIRAFDAEGHGGITLSEFREAVLPWLVGK